MTADEAEGGPGAVVGGALVRDGRVLMVHRSPARRWYPDVWDLPGGHVEAGEDPRAALVRELREELGVEAVVAGRALAHPDLPDQVRLALALTRSPAAPQPRSPADHGLMHPVRPP